MTGPNEPTIPPGIALLWAQLRSLRRRDVLQAMGNLGLIDAATPEEFLQANYPDLVHGEGVDWVGVGIAFQSLLDTAGLLAELRAERDAVEAEQLAEYDVAAAVFVRAVEAQLEAQRQPESAAVEVGRLVGDAVDKIVRKRWGPWWWVRRTEMGRVASVSRPSRTATVGMMNAGGRTGGSLVGFGIGAPVVGRSYPVQHPVRLPDAPTPFITGPVAAGMPWLKAPAGLTTWLYYFGVGDTGLQRTLWRVPMPDSDPQFKYTADMAVKVHVMPDRPTVSNPGHVLVSGPGMASRTMYVEEQAWERYGKPELAPSGYPYDLRLHRYPNFGVDGEEGAAVLSGTPHAHALWTHLSEGLDTDILLGLGRYSRDAPNLTPYPQNQPYDVMADLIASYSAGASWVSRFTGFVMAHSIATFYPAGGYYVDSGRWNDSAVLNAAGWTVDADTPGFALAGERVETWMTSYWVGGNPVPGPVFPVPLQGDGLANQVLIFRRDVWSTRRTLARLFVTRDGGSTAPYNFAQPPGWMGNCFVRPSGGGGLRAWWAGHDQQWTTVEGDFVHFQGSEDRLWVGECPPGGAWTWHRIDAPDRLNRLIHCNGDGSVVLAARWIGPDTVRHIQSHWITVDAGVTWRELPVPPYFVFKAGTADSYPIQGWLVDLP